MMYALVPVMVGETLATRRTMGYVGLVGNAMGWEGNESETYEEVRDCKTDHAAQKHAQGCCQAFKRGIRSHIDECGERRVPGPEEERE